MWRTRSLRHDMCRGHRDCYKCKHVSNLIGCTAYASEDHRFRRYICLRLYSGRVGRHSTQVVLARVSKAPYVSVLRAVSRYSLKCSATADFAMSILHIFIRSKVAESVMTKSEARMTSTFSGMLPRTMCTVSEGESWTRK